MLLKLFYALFKKTLYAMGYIQLIILLCFSLQGAYGSVIQTLVEWTFYLLMAGLLFTALLESSQMTNPPLSDGQKNEMLV